jgi:translocation and assembly module TamB
MSRRTKLVCWFAGGLIALCLLAAGVGAIIIQSGWFRDEVRERIISEVERNTGGHVEIGSFRFNWHNLTAEFSPFVLHGTEPLGGRPLFRANSIRVGLKIVSMLRRDVDFRSLTVEKPELAIVVHRDGSTNFPWPMIPPQSEDFVEQVLKLAIKKVAINNGFVDYNEQRLPLELEGENLAMTLFFDRKGPQYLGNVSFSAVHINAGSAHDLKFGLAASIALDKNGLHVAQGRLSMPHSELAVSGNMLNWVAPAGDFAARAHVAMGDVRNALGPGFPDRGDLAFDGRLKFSESDFRLFGRATGRGLDLRTAGLHLPGASFSANADVTDSRADLNNLALSAMGGSFQGRLTIDRRKTLRLEGQSRNISIHQFAEAARLRPLPWDGTVSGTLRASGVLTGEGIRDALIETQMDIAPASAGPAVSGHVNLSYDQRADALRLGPSKLSTGQSNVTLEGTLGQPLSVSVVTRDMDDLLPLAVLAGANPPARVPSKLVNGSEARFTGVLEGPLDNPTLRGRLELGQFEYAKQSFNRLTASVQLSRSRLNASDVVITHDQMRLNGSGHLALVDWHESDATELSGAFQVRNGDLARLIAEAGESWPASGSFSGSLTIQGTWGKPVVNAIVHGANLTAWNEKVASAQAEIRYAANTVEVTKGEGDAAGGRFQFSGTWHHAAGQWMDGALTFNVAAQGISLERISHVRDTGGSLGGKAELIATGGARIAKRKFDLQSLNGSLTVRDATVNDKPAGGLSLNADTSGETLKITGQGNLREARVDGSGEWKLAAGYPGSAHVAFTSASLATLDGIVSAARSVPAHDLPFRGTVSGSASLAGPLNNLDQMRGEVRLEQIRVTPNPDVQGRTATPDVTLENAGPIVFDITRTGADIRDARFSATDTQLAARGRIGFGEQAPWDVAVTGSINLRILRLFNSDLLASGHSTLRATVRGSLVDPQVNGRLELQNASLYLADLPNGVDKANGVIVFNRNRATIQKLDAESGGGHISFTGFVGFAAPMLTYRVGARAENVRYRSPQGASLTMDGSLDLTGTSKSSIVSGTLTVNKASFNPSTDIGTLLSQAARPSVTPPQSNDYFAGLQFDVHVQSALNLEIQTSLAHGLQGQADLHVTGTPQRPVLLGRISINQGLIEFFGNRYTINRGEVHFNNPLKLEPVVDLDLETRERGVTVDIMISGPLTRLNLSYRSDPPLKSDQIVALLTVGRTPNGPGGLANSEANAQQGSVTGGSNQLLQQALTAPAGGRLEKFFGVSHIRIDPQVSDVTTLPQAHLSMEQQISQSVTLTYTTNLARTQEQFVQLEWNLNREWSVVAVRDENGFFGIDFQLRKRFK